ncbi:hypothetical protein ERY430_40383 [Erythrobacter sp. EC-HK427]|nr:hypothetical protein ERY430_40383 [Erythrobacter sp. EC-HK427]
MDHTLFSARPASAKRRSRRLLPRNSAQGVEHDDLIEGVEMALSAMTAHALLQQQGYTINPF